MKLSLKYGLYLITCFLLFYCPLSAFADLKSPNQKESTFEIQVKDCLLTARVKDISLKIVLDEISCQTMVKIDFFQKNTMGQGFAGIGKESTLKPLFSALGDDYPPVREETVAALSRYKDERIFIYLTDILLYDQDEDVRARAAKALGDLGDKRAIDPLLTVLQDKEDWVRENVVDALGQIGEERAISFLMPVLKDGSKDVKSAANDAKMRINRYHQIFQ